MYDHAARACSATLNHSGYTQAGTLPHNNYENSRSNSLDKPQTLKPHDTESGCRLLSMSEKGNSENSESSQLEGLYRKASDPVLRTHLLMVWRMSLGDSMREVARMVGYSEKWVREIARRYESEGLQGLGDRRHAKPLEPGRGLC